MKFRFLALVFLVVSFGSSVGQARHVVSTWPIYSHGVIGGVPYACGYIKIRPWPITVGTPTYYTGFSYTPYYPHYATYRPTFGAIAYSATDDKVGYAWGEATQKAASKTAMRTCGKNDCAPIVWVQGGCAALATSKESEALGWAYANSKREAVKLALKSCRHSDATDCEERAWVCAF